MAWQQAGPGHLYLRAEMFRLAPYLSVLSFCRQQRFQGSCLDMTFTPVEESSALRWPWGSLQMLSVQGAAHGLPHAHVKVWLQAAALLVPATGSALRALQELAVVLQVAAPQSGGSTQAQDSLHAAQHGLTDWVAMMGQALAAAAAVCAPHAAGEPRVVAGRQNGQPGFWVLWPAHWPQRVGGCLLWSLQVWRQLAQPDPDGQPPGVEALGRQWQERVRMLRQRVPGGLNPANVLAAARALDWPARWVDGDVLQLGHGRLSRWWRSTLTDATPSIGVMLARDKTRTTRLLRTAGLPVPRHMEVGSLDAAERAAEALGWPVVVKPADQDKGAGARAHLQSMEQVRRAFDHAAAVSGRVLVEQHVYGREYRLTVVQGVLLWAHERVPAQVVGDGRHDVQTLIEQENRRRRAALAADPAGWVPMQVDEEMRDYLQETGVSLQAVPPAGVPVRLQRVPAATTGGGGLACFHTIHPDNRRLAERAAQCLRLDVAGVDLIMPDITRSWREAGGAVTEVNAMPQISLQTNPKLVQRLLQCSMPQGARIPLVLVLAGSARSQWLALWRESAQEAGFSLGISAPSGLEVGTERRFDGRTSAWEHMQALQMDREVDAMVLVCDGTEFFKTGLPFDRVDVLVVQEHQPRVLSLLLPYCTGLQFCADEPLLQQYAHSLPNQPVQWQVHSQEAVQTKDWVRGLVRRLKPGAGPVTSP